LAVWENFFNKESNVKLLPSSRMCKGHTGVVFTLSHSSRSLPVSPTFYTHTYHTPPSLSVHTRAAAWVHVHRIVRCETV